MRARTVTVASGSTQPTLERVIGRSTLSATAVTTATRAASPWFRPRPCLAPAAGVDAEFGLAASGAWPPARLRTAAAVCDQAA